MPVQPVTDHCYNVRRLVLLIAEAEDGTMTLDFTSIRGVVLDMDGVLWRGNSVLPGVADFFTFVRVHHIAFALATNNSTKRVEAYVERLNQIGVPVRPEQVVTSAVATAEYIARHYDPDDTPVYVIGGEGIRSTLAERGFREDPDHARVVVVGMDVDISFEKLTTATMRIRAGADFIGTNGDRTFPLPEGLAPGNGAFLALLQTATEVEPLIIGKPEAAMFEVALNRLGVLPERTLMIGDRLETDILGGARAGWKTALVLTGITTRDMAQQAAIKADAVFDDLAALHHEWQLALE